jgi:hypothetical protein
VSLWLSGIEGALASVGTAGFDESATNLTVNRKVQVGGDWRYAGR